MVLTPPRIHSIESALGWIADDELLEVTPISPAPAQEDPQREPPQALSSGDSARDDRVSVRTFASCWR